MRRSFWLLALLALCLASTPSQVLAQSNTVQLGSDVSLRLGGGLQTRLTYLHSDLNGTTTTDTDFGIRRARLSYRVAVGERWSLRFQHELRENPVFLDLYVTYKVNDNLSIRTGRMPDAQPRSYLMTSYRYADTYDRPNIANRWSSGTIGNTGRDYGVAFRYSLDRSRVHLFLHNGDASRSNNLRATTRSSSGFDDDTGMAISLYADHKPAALEGIEVGGFIGHNAHQAARTAAEGSDIGRSYTSYSAHAYYGATPGSQAFRLKADMIGIIYEYAAPNSPDQHTLGLNLFAAALVQPNLELFAQAERRYFDVEAINDAESFFIVGLNASMAPDLPDGFVKQRFTLAYEYMTSDAATAPTRHGLLAQLQFIF
ncbi:MAG: hypothetical protein RhofKO_24080 [Rhodothermales bacterium]